MCSNEIQIIRDKIFRNEERIDLLNAINNALKGRQQIELNFKSLSAKFKKLQKDATEQRNEYDRKQVTRFKELEDISNQLCKNHAKLTHRIEHIEWHLEKFTQHSKGHGGGGGGGGSQHHTHQPPHSHSHHMPPMSEKSTIVGKTHVHSPQPSTGRDLCRPSEKANLRNTSERLVNSITEIRKKICLLQDKLRSEIDTKKNISRDLSKIRRDISRQKKMLSTHRYTSGSVLPPITSK